MRHMGAEGNREKYHHPLPEDVSKQLGQPAVEWLARFHLDVPTAIRRDIVWSERRQQLIFQLGNCWQARNFATILAREDSTGGKKARAKNFTSGDVNECLHIYQSGSGGSDDLAVGEQQPSQTLVFVEDPVSAIRVAETGVADAMPLLGSHLGTARLIAVAGLYKPARWLFWLDSDKLKESRAMCMRARMMGLSARTIWTAEDPKCFVNEEIIRILS